MQKDGRLRLIDMAHTHKPSVSQPFRPQKKKARRPRPRTLPHLVESGLLLGVFETPATVLQTHTANAISANASSAPTDQSMLKRSPAPKAQHNEP
jgi:hypothetical protein